jgi:hypothetical protein
MEWELSNYAKVAGAHNLTVAKDRVQEALVNLSAALTCIACTE